MGQQRRIKELPKRTLESSVPLQHSH